MKSVTVLLILLFALAGCTKIENTSPDWGDPTSWKVGPVDGKVTWKGAGLLLDAKAELNCFGNKADGTEWIKVTPLKTDFKHAGGNAYSVSISAGELEFPSLDQIKSCAYKLITSTIDPEGKRKQAAVALAGDVSVGGMSKGEIKKLLSDSQLNSKVSTALSGMKMTH